MTIPWMLLVTVLLLAVQSFIYRKWGMSRLTYTRRFNQRKAEYGQGIELVETIENHKWLPLPWIRVESSLSAGLQFEKQDNLRVSSGQMYQNHRSLFHLLWYMRIHRIHKLTCAKRGFFKLETATLTCGDLFGSSQQIRSVPLDSSVLVLPRFLPLEELRLPSHSWQGDVIVRRWILRDPFMIAGVREYQPGDPLKSVNWKATARTGTLQVFQHDFTANRRLFIVLNIEESENMWKAITDPERIEYGISMAATLTQYAVKHGLEVGFVCNAHAVDAPGQPVWIKPAGGTAHGEFILEQMAKLELERVCDTPTLLQGLIERKLSGLDMVWITAFTNEKMLAMKAELVRMGNAVEIIQPQAERRNNDAAVSSFAGSTGDY